MLQLRDLHLSYAATTLSAAIHELDSKTLPAKKAETVRSLIQVARDTIISSEGVGLGTANLSAATGFPAGGGGGNVVSLAEFRCRQALRSFPQ